MLDKFLNDGKVAKSITGYKQDPVTGEWVKDELTDVERKLAEMAGAGTDATREPMYSPASLTVTPGPSAGDGHGDPIGAVPKPYSFEQHDNVVRVGPMALLIPGEGGGLPEPANFGAPVPGTTPQGTAWEIMKRGEGIFADLIKPEGTDQGA